MNLSMNILYFITITVNVLLALMIYFQFKLLPVKYTVNSYLIKFRIVKTETAFDSNYTNKQTIHNQIFHRGQT